MVREIEVMAERDIWTDLLESIRDNILMQDFLGAAGYT